MPDLVKNSIHTVTISGYTSKGSGVAHINGQTVFVKGGIRGEILDIKILKAGKSVSYGKIQRILEASPHRLAPSCPFFGKCGGCSLLNMDYEEELEMKKARVDDALHRIGGLDLSVSEIIGAPTRYGYRNKAVFAVGRDNGRACTGFFRDRSHDVIPVEKCAIQSNFAARAAKAFSFWMNKYNVPLYDEKTGRGMLRHLFCRIGFSSGEGQITIISALEELPARKRLVEILRDACPETVSIVLNVNSVHGNTILSDRFITLWGREYITDRLCGLSFRLSPRSFYQINPVQAEKLYNMVIEFSGLTGKETVLDLYCGTGTITLCMSGKAKKVIGAEIIPEAINDARKNASENKIENAEFICTDASQISLELAGRGLRPDVITLDPPRKGLSPEVIKAATEMAPNRIVYVSCDPATLSRDLRLFSDRGYDSQKAISVDMFPATGHVETVCLLGNRNLKPDAYVDLSLDMEDYRRIKAGGSK